MDVVIQVISFVLISLFLYLVLKDNKSTFAVFLLLGAGIVIFLFVMPYVNEIIDKYTTERFLGVFGEKTVNVLKVNLALDGILRE